MKQEAYLALTEREKPKEYFSVSEYLSAFEHSDLFEKVKAQHKQELKTDHPQRYYDDLTITRNLRLSDKYWQNLINFYREGNKFYLDLEKSPIETKEALENYWEKIKNWNHEVALARATAQNREQEIIRVHNIERKREEAHTLAGLTILGGRVDLENGETIVCSDNESEDEFALDREQWAKLGRTLVSIYTEEKNIERLDPERENKKVAARFDFLQGGVKYSNGHWVRSDEK